MPHPFHGRNLARTAMTSLAAGAIAIALNIIALWSADLIRLPTAHGGLLNLLQRMSGVAMPHHRASFMILFHALVGLAMALAYGFVLAPFWRGPAWLLGLLYAAAVWIANAFVVLPLIGQGIAGSASLSVAGILWFAAAHTLFFVSLAIVYRRLAAD